METSNRFNKEFWFFEEGIMTKTRFLAISLLVFTLLCGAFVFASCKNKEEDVETTGIQKVGIEKEEQC